MSTYIQQRNSEVCEWFVEQVSLDPARFVFGADLYQSYTNWCRLNHKLVGERNAFFRWIGERPGVRRARFRDPGREMKPHRAYVGLELKSEPRKF